MAVTCSGLYFPTWRDIVKGVFTTTEINLTSTSQIKVAMYSNSLTPSFSADTSYSAAPYTSNEIAEGGGYTTGGVVLGSGTVTESPTGTLMYDAADASWSNSTIANARAALVYADGITTPTAKPVLLLVDFGSAYSTTSGTFTIQWAAGGIMTIDLTPSY